jgi:hypothetical protein
MSNETATSTSGSSFTLLNAGWNAQQQSNYSVQEASSNAIITALIVALTGYAVTSWISMSRKTGTSKKEQWSMTYLRPRPYWVTSTILFWIIYTLLFNNSMYPMLGSSSPIGYKIAMPFLVFGGVILHLALDWVWKMLCGKNKVSEEQDTQVSVTTEHQQQEVLDEEALVKTAAQQQQMKPKPKIHYINNIKIFLTNIVLLHHLAIMVGGAPGGLGWVPPFQYGNPTANWGVGIFTSFVVTNASYFMQLFFFYSGFFVPKSFDKKGPSTFLHERLKRIGIPQVVYNFLLGPYIQGGLCFLLFYKDKNVDFATDYLKLSDPGVTWFLQQLIVLGFIYTFACGTNWTPKMKCPTVLGFFLISLVIGLVTGIIALFLPSGAGFFGVPQFWNDYPSFLIFFFAGVVAQRNNWLDEIKQNRSRLAIYIWAVVAFANAVVLMVVSSVWTLRADRPTLTWFVFNFVWKGYMEMGFSLAVTVFFMDFVNDAYWCTKFFSASFYTAYIIQPLVFIFAQYFWVLILKSTNNVEEQWSNENGLYFTYNNDNLVLPGFLFVSIVVMIIIWPLSYGIRSVPGFSKVL